MSREQLETIANEHKIKGIKKLDDEHLAYAILDAEATEESVKPVPEKPKARRGRPAKTAKAEEPAVAKEVKEETPAPKKKTETVEPAPARKQAEETPALSEFTICCITYTEIWSP